MAKRRSENGARPLELTPVSEWEEAERVRLPSGKVVDLRRPDVVDLIAQGDAPDMLTNLVLAGMKDGKREVEITAETFPQVLATMNVIVRAAFVWPRVVEGEPQTQDEISVKRISFQDKSFVFNWVLGAQYQAAESFRPGPTGGVQPVPAVQDVRESAQPDVRDPGE